MSWPCLWNLIWNSQWSHGRPQGGINGLLSSTEIGIKNQIFLEKSEVGILNSDQLIWFLQWHFFADMKLTLHKSQVHSYSVMQWWACSSHMSLYLEKRVAKVASGFFYCCFFFRNNTMASNLQRFTLYYGSRHFVAWDCWTHTSCQVWQRDSDMLIAVTHVYLYLKHECTSECTRALKHKFTSEKKQEWVYSNASTNLKNPLSVLVWPMCLSVKLHLCSLLFMQYKITWLVRITYIYAGLWEYALIVKTKVWHLSEY